MAGANEGVIQMLEEIGSEDRVDAIIEEAAHAEGKRSWASGIDVTSARPAVRPTWQRMP
jgi:hypothetical protein